MFEAASTLRTDGIRVLDLDESVTRQRELLRHNASVVDLKTLAPRLRFLSTRAAMRDFAASLNPSDRNQLTFYGSGDFHHLSAELIRQFDVPLSVVVFDNHPDWDISSPWPCCGSWINEVMKFPFVQKVVVIGLGRYDLKGWHLLRGNVAALESGKLELYPASWRRSKRMFAPDMYWKTFAREGLERVMNRVLERLPTEEVYLSVDKDCLRPESALTNWEKGEVQLSELRYGIERMRTERRIVGADITGEYSRGANSNSLFRWISNCNHPQSHLLPQARFSQRELEVNQNTNLALLQSLQGTAGAAQ